MMLRLAAAAATITACAAMPHTGLKWRELAATEKHMYT